MAPSVASSTTRVLSSALRAEERTTASSSSSASFVVGTALALSGAATAAALTLCEEEEEKRQFRRFVTKQGLQDPMTTYQKRALTMSKKELLQEDDESTKNQAAPQPEESKERQKSIAQDKVQVEAPFAVQATSADSNTNVKVKPNIKAFPTEMTESEARLEESARKAKQHSGGIKIFSGNGNMSLALEIVRHLGISLGKATVGRFADGEVNVVINENVRGKDVYIVQPTCPPVNDNLIELLLMVSTLRRASARRITVVIPYYGYARQDRKMQARQQWW